MAELFGKATGCSKGKGGAMHFFAPDKNYWVARIVRKDVVLAGKYTPPKQVIHRDGNAGLWSPHWKTKRYCYALAYVQWQRSRPQAFHKETRAILFCGHLIYSFDLNPRHMHLRK